jgi:DNA helicase II / ATP-dependent DNA helicase PcrA
MSEDLKLNDKQIKAIKFIESDLRILAGPGTGKSKVLTEKFIFLINEKHVKPSEIVALTFTRASANDLRKKVKKQIPTIEKQLRISTLHSFCLRQLLRNSNLLDQFPTKFRIADDWEERWIIQEDIKKIINAKSVNDIQKQLLLLSADWQSLNVENRNPNFIGAWREHSIVYRYILRSEIVYQLKKALDQYSDDIDLEIPIKYLLVDEYQDLNKCDQAIIRALSKKGAKLFIAGDDDQSIYGFRKAFPSGIRDFLLDYPNSKNIELEICYRCDKDILDISQFVADLDTDRPKKKIKPKKNCLRGKVELIKNRNENDEARTIAELCKLLISNSGYKPEEILILIRSNNKNAYSNLFSDVFNDVGVPFTDKSILKSPTESGDGRLYYSILRLIMNKTDDLAWRTILRNGRNGIGQERINFLYKTAREKNLSFSELMKFINLEEKPLDNIYINVIKTEVEKIFRIINKNQSLETQVFDITKKLKEIFNSINDYGLINSEIEDYFIYLSKKEEVNNFSSYLSLFYEIDEKIEQVIVPGKVNLLTMHQAKGLTSEVVILPVAEDEVIPGKNIDFENIGDERRLLYVSLSRACHRLYISYCNKREINTQKYLGRNAGNTRRSLTRFLRDFSLTPVWGEDLLDNYE